MAVSVLYVPCSLDSGTTQSDSACDARSDRRWTAAVVGGVPGFGAPSFWISVKEVDNLAERPPHTHNPASLLQLGLHAPGFGAPSFWIS